MPISLRRPGRAFSTVVAATMVALVAMVVGPAEPDIAPPVSAASGDTATRYAPLAAPLRVLDTRVGTPIARLPADTGLSFDPVTTAVAVSAGVAEADVVAVVANVTMVNTGGAGFMSVFPTGEQRPNSSSINADGAGQIVANMVSARLGAGGLLSIYSSTSTDVIVDVQGLYVRATEATAGRFVEVPQARAIDTRGTSRLGAGGSIVVDLAGAGVPASASAAVINVTSVFPSASGFVTVWAPNVGQPDASNLNYVAGSIVANQVIAGVADSKVAVFTFAETDILVDVVGYMTGSSDPSSSAGLFVPLSPGRLLDTRNAGGPTAGAPVSTNQTISLAVNGQQGVPASGVAALAVNATATQTTGTGFLTVWRNGVAQPTASSLNWVGSGRTVANHVTTSVGNGAVNLFTNSSAHLLADVTGYYTDGTIAPPSAGPRAPLDFTDTTIQGPTPQGSSPPAVGSHAFIYQPTSASLGYGRWATCSRQLTFAIQAERATQAHIDQLYAAIRVVEAATGFDFVPYASPPSTSEGLDDRRPPNGADIIFGFSDGGSTPRLAGGVLGTGGGFWQPSTSAINTGFVMLDVIDLSTGNDLLTTAIHELGHMMGLNHVDSNSNIMFPLNIGLTSLGTGDRQGFWRLGTAQPCLTPRAPVDESELVLVEVAHDR